MSKELEVKKVVVAQSQKDCEDLLVMIVSERRVADEQRKGVEADSERISVEAAECKSISDDAEADLAVAMPALEKAMEEVDKLDKNSISEVKASLMKRGSTMAQIQLDLTSSNSESQPQSQPQSQP